MKDLREIARNNGLNIVVTTNDINGAPRCLKQAITGFTNFEEAKELAERYGLDTVSLYKRSGWNYWHRLGRVYNAYEIDEHDYSDDYRIIYKEERNDYYNNNVLPMLDEFYTDEEKTAFLENENTIIEALDNLKENEAVLTYQGEFNEVISLKTMEFSRDSQYWQIGVMSL